VRRLSISRTHPARLVYDHPGPRMVYQALVKAQTVPPREGPKEECLQTRKVEALSHSAL